MHNLDIQHSVMAIRQWTMLFLLSWFICCAPVYSQPYLQYKNRGPYSEGIKGTSVAGKRIDLIFAVIPNNEKSEKVPEDIHLKFYLHKKYAAYPTVYERDPVTRYCLGDIANPMQWQGGQWADFTWTTSIVIKPLQKVRRQLRIDNLVSLIYVAAPQDDGKVFVAPGIIIQNKSPKEITEYVFGFKTNFPSSVEYEIYRSSDGKAVTSKQQIPTVTGSLATITWKCKGSPKGIYEVRVKAFNKHESVRKLIQFYHQPSLDM